MLPEKAWNFTIADIKAYSTFGYSEESIAPWDYAKILGKGMDVDWSKTKDGRKYYNEQTVKDFKNASVSHVRIRIADKATDEFKNDPNEKNIQEVVAWWSIVAKRYKDYYHLSKIAFRCAVSKRA